VADFSTAVLTKAPITGPGGVEQQIAWQAENDSTAGYGTLINDVASYA
jgi:hypothetical protein